MVCVFVCHCNSMLRSSVFRLGLETTMHNDYQSTHIVNIGLIQQLIRIDRVQVQSFKLKKNHLNCLDRQIHSLSYIEFLTTVTPIAIPLIGQRYPRIAQLEERSTVIVMSSKGHLFDPGFGDSFLLLLPITIVTTISIHHTISQLLHFFQLHLSQPAQPFL
jgi:hypothetical protein